jgi:hypothetical protein
MENQGKFDNEGFTGVLRCNDWCIDLGKHGALLVSYRSLAK